MSDSQAVEQPRDASAVAIELYETFYPLLRYLATKRFRIAEDEADDLVHEVFLSYLSHAESVRDARAWLVGAVCNASRHHLRIRAKRSGDEPFVDHAVDQQTDALLLRLEIQSVLNRLHANCRQTLSLHYLSGMSAREMAETLATTCRYAEKMIHKCLARALGIYQQLARARG